MAGKVRAALLLVAMAGAMLVLQACREHEQDRVLFHEPGVYKGEPDPSLSQSQVQDLRQRAQRQSY
jgi:hypothetical protein